jgi:FkbM family methyltransferase
MLLDTSHSALRSNIEPKSITIGWLDLTIYGRADDAYFQHIESHVPELESYGRLIETLPEEPVIIDVGANIGVTVAMALALRPKARVIALEPSPMAFACLTLTAPQAELHNVGAGAKNGTAHLLEASFLAASHLGRVGVPVPITTVDRVAKGLKPDLIKIDVEGYEPDVIEGMRLTLKKDLSSSWSSMPFASPLIGTSRPKHSLIG